MKMSDPRETRRALGVAQHEITDGKRFSVMSTRKMCCWFGGGLAALCPMTGQPDFAHLVIDYVPGRWLVESKSLKLYLGSFRNHGSFHEDCTVGIGKRLVKELKPNWLRIGGYWYPRGGIPIDVFWQTAAPPKGLWLPDQGVPPYRGRG